MSFDLDAAISRRAILLEEIEKIEKLIELWRWWQDSALPTSETLSDVKDSPTESTVSTEVGTEGDRGTHASPAQVTKEVLAVLVAAERPMKRGTLLSALTKRGVKVGGTDKSKVLGTILWRAKDHFVSLPGWGYWIKDRPYLPALYDPLKVANSQDDPFADLLG